MIIQGSSGVQEGIAVPDLLSIRVNRHNFTEDQIHVTVMIDPPHANPS